MFASRHRTRTRVDVGDAAAIAASGGDDFLRRSIDTGKYDVVGLLGFSGANSGVNCQRRRMTIERVA